MTNDDQRRGWTGPETEFARIVAAAWHEFRYPRPAVDEPTGSFERAIRAALDEAAAAPSPVAGREQLAELVHNAWHSDFADAAGKHYLVADALISAGVRGPVEQQDREALAALFRAAPGRDRLGDQTPGEIADRLLARYDIRERGETQAGSRKPKDYLEEGERVSAHRLDRVRSVVVGALMPYDETQGERVRDDAGVVWCVEAASVRPVPGDQS